MQTKNTLPSPTFGNIGESSSAVLTYLEPKKDYSIPLMITGMLLIAFLVSEYTKTASK
jgi:hypothetical protein